MSRVLYNVTIVMTELKIGGEVFVLCILIGGISNVKNRKITH